MPIKDIIIDKYGTHIQKTFQSLRKEAREHMYLSFHRAYILSLILIIIL